jgi:hypothetical protein
MLNGLIYKEPINLLQKIHRRDTIPISQELLLDKELIKLSFD